MTHLYELAIGDRFRLVGAPLTPPGGPMPTDLGVLIAGRIDGVYRQVRAVDPATNQQACDAYDRGAPFFCLFAGSEVELVD